MGTTTVRLCSVDELIAAPNLSALLEEYAAESSIEGIGAACAQFDAYRAIEQNGIMRCLGAFHGDRLVGFLVFLFANLPHYGKVVASQESFFVARDARKGGAGIKLLHAAEEMAREIGAAGFIASAPVGGKLELVLPHVGYRHTNQIFYKALT